MGRLSPHFWFGLSLLVAALALPPQKVLAQGAIEPGEAVVTGFSGTSQQDGRKVIDIDGAVGSIVDLRRPSAAPLGANWKDVPQHTAVTAGQVGQVFGVTLDDADPPNIYMTATSAFGLHRNPDNTDWMAGMWGAPDGGPGTVWKLDAANNYQPETFADIKLDGRTNTGAALGNIAFDRWNKQFYVSDLETGMIYRLRASDGADLGHYDHGVDGRAVFFDLAGSGLSQGEFRSLPTVPFDPASAAKVADCPSGDFSRTPSCWNFADFRRRVWGVGVRRDPATEQVRLHYAVWGSQGFGNPDYAAGEDDQRNSIWSVRIKEDGTFDTTSARREFFLPDFFRSPEAIARAGRSHPVADIAFPASGDQDAMLLAERGGVRNLGLAAEDAFAYPHEARVLRYELTDQGFWRGAGRYDVGYYDRSEAGPPYLRGSAAGGVSFGMGYDDGWNINPAKPDAFVWMTGDGLCSPQGACFDPEANDHTNAAPVDGLEGRAARPYEALEPVTAFQPYPAPGPITPPTGPDQSFIIELGAGAPDQSDSTRIGDVVVYQTIPAEGLPGEAIPPVEWPVAEAPVEPYPGAPPEGWDPAPLPPDGWPEPPPPLLETNLAIEKTGPALCQEGVTCVYAVKITNLGAVPYVGPLAVNDTMPDDAALVAASAGWNCAVAAPVVSCVTAGPALLNVATSATLTLTILLPADVAEDHVKNCAGIDWFEMGTDDGPGDGDDYDCVETPVIDGFDLGLQKDGPPQCSEAANCLFGVTITNHGPGEFNGVLAVHDTLPAGASLLANQLGWSCVQTDGDVHCTSEVLTLPAAAVEAFGLLIHLPDGIAGAPVENCALIDWAAMGADDGAADAHVDEDCHSVDVIDGAGFFDLTVTKAGPAHCDGGGNCDYAITVTNNGPDDYAGEVVIRDTPPAGSAYVGVSAGWVCGAVVPIDCSLLGGPHVLQPGDSHSLTLTIQLPMPPPDVVGNCITLQWGAPGMPPDDNLPPGALDAVDGECIPTALDAGFDVEIAKTGPSECYEGGICEYSVSLTNHGPQWTAGVLSFIDALPAGATLEAALGGWLCQPGPAADSVRCDLVLIPELPAGTIKTVTLQVRLPDPVAGDTVTNCATMEWSESSFGPMFYTGDDDPATDGPACVDTPVLAADLAPFGGTTCKLGETCSLDVSIENRGGKLFKGSAGLKGTLDPAVSIESIKSLTSGMTCNVTGNGAYECRADELSLKPGDAAKLELSVAIPGDFPHERIVHRKEMLWPDSHVKDAKPENDRHTSTIMIEQPEEPEAPPPQCDEGWLEVDPGKAEGLRAEGWEIKEVTRGGKTILCAKAPPPPECVGGSIVGRDCVCPKGTEREKIGPNAYRCVDLPPPITCTGGTIKNGECVCPNGYERKEVGDHAYRCVKLPPPTTCEGGTVKNGECLCPNGYERKKVGDYAYRCVKLPPPITCKGGRVDGGACYCPKGTERKQTGPNAYECVKLPPPITCKGGRVDGGVCYCPKGTERKQTGPNAYECVKPPPPITCKGGRVDGGVCYCPKGTERKQTGPNAYECVKLPPPIICKGGKVDKGVCYCPKGTERKPTGPNAYECVKLPPPITCKGGRVDGGVCYCPKGTERKQTGTNAYECVVPPPKLTCEGGKIAQGRCVCPKGTSLQALGNNKFRCLALPTIR
ncbi:MAG: hypothetical protein ACRECX_02350 [Methyloceanibacter sp.]|uniref:hypothetical protein n=1 Tax=Methyloceanibacter sp. TaxID=1965321 RepID=UPI003D6CA04A